MTAKYHIMTFITLMVLGLISISYWTDYFGNNLFPGSTNELIVDLIHLLVFVSLYIYGKKAVDMRRDERLEK